MQLNKINWKIKINNPEVAEPDKVFKVFSSWIEDSEEIFVDVSDYQHVVDGPHTVLIGYYCDYWLDNTGRSTGFLYNQRQPVEGDNSTIIRKTLATTIKAAKRLNDNPEFKGAIDYSTEEIQFTINDRLLAPNSKSTYSEIKPELEKVFDPQRFLLKKNENTPQRFSVTITANQGISIDDLLAL